MASLGQPVARTDSSIRLEQQYDRGRLARGLLLIYGLLLAVLLLLVGLHRITVGESLQLINGYGAPIVGLLGACAGYYFGRKSAPL